ncbi:hypothetical protein [Enterococcus rotai]|uniref:hypothetical protein n=1 Tax=Enterococcus rotai TaxID=118060 RepID=UPI0032B34519
MIEIHNQPRGSGKTTEVIKRMKDDVNLVCLVHSNRVKELYPSELRHRLFTFDQFDIRTIDRLRVRKAIVDEGLIGSKVSIANMYYKLGHAGKETVVFGTDI